MSLSSVPSESTSSVKDEPLSPMHCDPSNNLLSELFAPAANIGLIVKEESQNSVDLKNLPTQPPQQQQPPPPRLPVNTPMHSRPRASIPLLSHGNRLMYSKVKLENDNSEHRKYI